MRRYTTDRYRNEKIHDRSVQKREDTRPNGTGMRRCTTNRGARSESRAGKERVVCARNGNSAESRLGNVAGGCIGGSIIVQVRCILQYTAPSQPKSA
ncbi:hypothetical protein J6590_033470 [Homalodisca vitripennis]|nr:hypothetical protein J6590_033470 [Homalodisca vitripennis]